MIYIKEHNSLFDSPRVEEPNGFKTLPLSKVVTIDENYEQKLSAYNKWLSSKVSVVGDHTWVDGQEVKEGVDYWIEYQIKKEGRWVGGWTKFGYAAYLGDGFPNYKRIVAIPIKEKDNDVTSESMSDFLNSKGEDDYGLYEEDIKNDLRNELFSLQTESGITKLTTDEIDMLSESIYKNVVKNFVTSQQQPSTPVVSLTASPGSSVQHYKWTKEKPVPTEECLLMVAQRYKDHVGYDLFVIQKIDTGEGWYLGLCCPDGVEWGDFDDLGCDLYMTMPLL